MRRLLFALALIAMPAAAQIMLVTPTVPGSLTTASGQFQLYIKLKQAASSPCIAFIQPYNSTLYSNCVYRTARENYYRILGEMGLAVVYTPSN